MPGSAAPRTDGISVTRSWPPSAFIRYSSLFLALLAGFWILGFAGAYWRCHREHRPFSLNALALLDGHYHFSDFKDFNPVTESFIIDGVKGEVYPAPTICGYLFFTRNFQKPLDRYLTFLCFSFLLIASAVSIAFYRASHSLLAALVPIATLLACYPLLFLLERGNMEGIVFIVISLALIAFITRHHLTAGLLIAAAASMKIFPAVLFALLLHRKRYRDLFISVAAIVPIQVLSLAILGPSISSAYVSVRDGLRVIAHDYFFGYPVISIGYDHSILSLLKQALHFRYQAEVLHQKILAVGAWYSPVAAISLAALYWFRIRKLPLLNQAMCLIIAAVLLPYLSFEYTLGSMYLVWAMFMLYLACDGSRGPGQIPFRAAICILGLIAFLFAPVNYITGRVIIYGGQFKALALIALGWIVLNNPMRSTLFGDLE